MDSTIDRAHDKTGTNEDSRRQLGVKLQLSRKTRSLTLRELAERSQCSESLLSRIENGKASPSLPLLHRLVQALDINVAWLFNDVEPDQSPIYRRGQRPVITLDRSPGAGGISFERIIPFKAGHLLQCNIHHVEVHGQSGEAIMHEGEEVGYVLQGRIALTIDGDVHVLEAGDAFSFRSDLPHSYRNVGDVRASILWVCTPPTF